MGFQNKKRVYTETYKITLLNINSYLRLGKFDSFLLMCNPLVDFWFANFNATTSFGYKTDVDPMGDENFIKFVYEAFVRGDWGLLRQNFIREAADKAMERAKNFKNSYSSIGAQTPFGYILTPEAEAEFGGDLDTGTR